MSLPGPSLKSNSEEAVRGKVLEDFERLATLEITQVSEPHDFERPFSRSPFDTNVVVDQVFFFPSSR